MKYLYGFLTLCLCAFAVFLGRQILVFYKSSAIEQAQLLEAQRRYETAKNDELQLQRDLEYFKKPENLEKELRARFNYRKEDEKLMIIVPNATSQTSSTASST